MSVNLLRQQEDDAMLASATYNLGLALFYFNKDVPKAQMLFEESLALKRLIGDRGGMIRRLGMLSEIALVEERFAEADAYLKEMEGIVENLDAPMRKLEYYGLLRLHLEVQADWPHAIKRMKEGLQLAVQLDNNRYILLLNLALARYYTFANLLNQAKIYLERAAHLFLDTDIPRLYSDCFLTFSFYWLAINHPSDSAACFVYFLRLNKDTPTYKHEADRLSLALETHFSPEEIDNLRAELPVKESIELIGQYLAKL